MTELIPQTDAVPLLANRLAVSLKVAETLWSASGIKPIKLNRRLYLYRAHVVAYADQLATQAAELLAPLLPAPVVQPSVSGGAVNSKTATDCRKGCS